MRRLVLMVVLAAIGCVGVLVGTALAASQRGLLYLGAQPACSLAHYAHEGTATASTYRLVYRARTGQLIGRVVLRQAAPSTTYTVRLIQGGPDCHTDDGTLVTNARGRGRATIREAATSVKAVLVVCPSTGDCLASKPVFAH